MQCQTSFILYLWSAENKGMERNEMLIQLDFHQNGTEPGT